MQKVSRKAILKWLKKECEKLPKETYEAYHRYSKPRYEMIEGQTGLVGGVIEEHNKNHKRRAYSMYKRYGWRGILEYFAKYGFKLSDMETAIQQS